MNRQQLSAYIDVLWTIFGKPPKIGPWDDRDTPVFSSNEKQRQQLIELSRQLCYPRAGAAGPHGLQAVETRSWRDGFRKRTYWKCWYCDLRVERVK